jgi:hypothetical protein
VKCDDIRPDLEAFALDALQERERRRVQTHVAVCRDCSDVVRAYQTAVAHLSLAVTVYRARPRLKEKLLGSIGALRPVVTPRSLFLSSRWWAAAAAVFLLMAVGGVTWAVILSSHVRDLQRDNANLQELSQLDNEQRAALLRLQAELSSTKSEQRRMVRNLEEQATLIVLALDPELQPTELAGTAIAPQASCRYVWSTTQKLGALTCHNLAQTSANSVYVLWVNLNDKPHNAGYFSPRADGSAQLLVKLPSPKEGEERKVGGYWVTLEPVSAAASSNPGTDVVLIESPTQIATR